MPEDDSDNAGMTSGQTLTLTEAGKLALNKLPLQKVTTSPSKIITAAPRQINRPVKIVTLNSSKASSGIQKIQAKPIVINAPYVIPQTNRTATTTTIQSASSDKKGTKIIRLTPEQFAAIKSGV